MHTIKNKTIWFVTGSQHLYGKEALDKVAENSREIARQLDHKLSIPVSILFKPVLTSSDGIYQLSQEANADADCF